MNLLLIYFGKLLSFIVRTFNLGNGSTWPGHIALELNPKFIKQILKNKKTKIVFVIGTNGKTTTSSLIKTILEKDGKKVLHNASGANLLNGVASTLILGSNIFGKLNKDFAIFEVDENAFPHVAKEITPDFVVALNLFRDQLDRYGEVNTIGKKWKESVAKLPQSTTLILNADDPEIAFLGEKAEQRVYYFGLSEKNTNKETDHAADSLYCPICSSKLIYSKVYFSHLGNWSCKKCGFRHPLMTITSSPIYPLDGLYNKYNVHAALLVATVLSVPKEIVKAALEDFAPAFGRGETIKYKGHKVRLFLSKNPTGFNQTIDTVIELGAKIVLVALNDRVADGEDVSWIWDVDFEKLVDSVENIIITGDRAEDMGLRVKYAESQMSTPIKSESNGKWQIEKDYSVALELAINKLSGDEVLYILPTYTAMLDLRKIIGGKKIL